MPVTRIKSRWVTGNLQFITEAGEVILEIDRAGLMGLGDNDEQAPVLHSYDLLNADGPLINNDFDLTFPTEITDIWLIKVAAAENNNTNTVQVQHDDGTVISDAMNIQDAGDGDIVRAATIDPSQARIDPETSGLRIVQAKANNNDNCHVLVYILGRRFAG